MFIIFTEIIELNFCGLQKNIKRNIIQRSELDALPNSDYRESLIEIEKYKVDMLNKKDEDNPENEN